MNKNKICSLKKGDIVIAQWNYETHGIELSTGEKDFSFKLGDCMKILEIYENNWVKVEKINDNKKNNIIGVIPISHIKLKPISFKTGDLLQAIADYQSTGIQLSTGENDISIKKFDRLKMLEQKLGGWVKVESKGLIGVVPCSYVQKVTETNFLCSPNLNNLEKLNLENLKSRKENDNNYETKLQKTRVFRVKTSPDLENFKFEQEETDKNLKRTMSIDVSDKIDLKNQEKIVHQKYKFPSEYIFSVEDSTENILFTSELINNYPQLRAGNLIKLIEKLTHPEYVDPNYVFEFLLTFRSFTTPKELLTLLIERFHIPNPCNIEKNSQELENFQKFFVKPTRLRVFNVIKKWLDEHWYDFENDQELLENMKKFTETMKISGMENAASSLNKLINKKNNNENRKSIMFTKPAPKPIEPDIKSLSGCDSQLTFLAFHPEEIARQLTLIEFNIFQSIKPSECMGQCWAKKEKQFKSPNILNMIQRFNKVSTWVSSTIVQIENIKTRAEAITRFIEIAEHLKSMNNFNGTMEILAGLRSASVHRLKKTWNHVSNHKYKLFEELLLLLSPDSNYSKLRNYLHYNISPPCIPYLGVYLTDLTFIEDGNPDMVGSLINFDKCRRIACVIKEIKQYQQTPYYFQTVPIITGFLLAVGEYIDENQCYQLSLIIEPRSGKIGKEKDTKFWRKSSALRKKEELNKRSQHISMLFNISPKKNNNATTTTTTTITPEINTQQNMKSKEDDISLDDLVDCLIEGNNEAFEQYISSLNKSEEEKDLLREKVVTLFEEKMENRGAEKIDNYHKNIDFEEEEKPEIPYDLLVDYVINGDISSYDAFFDSIYDIYLAERIREKVEKMVKEKISQK